MQNTVNYFVCICVFHFLYSCLLNSLSWPLCCNKHCHCLCQASGFLFSCHSLCIWQAWVRAESKLREWRKILNSTNYDFDIINYWHEVWKFDIVIMILWYYLFWKVFKFKHLSNEFRRKKCSWKRSSSNVWLTNFRRMTNLGLKLGTNCFTQAAVLKPPKRKLSLRKYTLWQRVHNITKISVILVVTMWLLKCYPRFPWCFPCMVGGSRGFSDIYTAATISDNNSGFLFPHTPCLMLFCRFKKISKEKSTSL